MDPAADHDPVAGHDPGEPWGTVSLFAATDRLRTAGIRPSARAPAALAADGRTRRIRATAASRLPGVGG